MDMRARWYGDRKRWQDYLLAMVGIALVTAVTLPNRDRLNAVTVALSYLVVVLASATLGGLGPGIFISVVAFFTFNFFFLPPYHLLTVGDRQDVVALFVFLIVAGVTSELVSRLQQREQEARRRAIESETLARLSTELIADVTLDTILATVVEQVARIFSLESAAVLLPDVGGALHVRLAYPASSSGHYLADREHASVAAHVYAAGVTAGVGGVHRAHRPHGPGQQNNIAPTRHRRVLYVPVVAGRGAVGVMGVAAVRGADFSPEERRLLGTFANQAALAIERARLTEEATRATALGEADRLKSALLAAVSHDLRTPLASIKAAATSLLQEEIAWDRETRREFLEAIDEETDRLARLVGDLLDLTRIEGGALKPEKGWYEIGEVIHQVADRLAPLHVGHPIRIVIAEDVPPVAYDYVEIGQVVTNLIENALKYGDAGGEIVVSAARADDLVRVSVRDRGLGIPPGDVGHVFEPFYRVRRGGVAGRIWGTGLGLAICKGLVEAHGGEVGVETAEGAGSEFWFTLPITAMPEVPTVREMAREGSATR